MGATEVDRLKQLLKRSDNKICADCTARQPRWASINLGCFICIRCSGIHRSIGVHISKVRSVTLDEWQPAWVDNMERWGNKKVNQVYEANLGNARKPDPDTGSREMEKFIRQKYELKLFMGRQNAKPEEIRKKTKQPESNSEEETSDEDDSDDDDDDDESDSSEEMKSARPVSRSKVPVLESPKRRDRPSRAAPPAMIVHQKQRDLLLMNLDKDPSTVRTREPLPEFGQFSSNAAQGSNRADQPKPTEDFAQFGSFFSSTLSSTSTTEANNGSASTTQANSGSDKSFIMSLFQNAPSNATNPRFYP